MICCVETERHREESRDRDRAGERGEDGIPPPGCSRAHPHITHLLDQDQSVRGQRLRRTLEQSYFIQQVSQCQSNFLWPKRRRQKTLTIFIVKLVRIINSKKYSIFVLSLRKCHWQAVKMATGCKLILANLIFWENQPLRMISPKVQRMQRSIRINEGQLLGLAEKARWVDISKTQLTFCKMLNKYYTILRLCNSIRIENYSLSATLQPIWYIRIYRKR